MVAVFIQIILGREIIQSVLTSQELRLEALLFKLSHLANINYALIFMKSRKKNILSSCEDMLGNLHLLKKYFSHVHLSRSL